MKINIIKRIGALLMAFSLGITVASVNIDNVAAATAADAELIENPVTAKAGDMVWDCVWFGSYPQAEVMPSGEYAALDHSVLKDGDVIVSDDLYNKLESATGWDDKGDVTIDGTKFRRIKKADATYSEGEATGTGTYYNWSDSTTYHYFKYEPIKWRVLNKSGNDVFLLADKGLDTQLYHDNSEAITWKASGMRKWLNGYDDYSSDSFMGTAFSEAEQSIIKTTNVTTENNTRYDTRGGNATEDKVFLLSEKEVSTDSATAYGFASEYDDRKGMTRTSKSSTYAKAMGAYTITSIYYLGNCQWWLRTPGYERKAAADVSYNGMTDLIGNGVTGNEFAVRPALHLDITSYDYWSYAGTVSSYGTEDISGGVCTVTFDTAGGSSVIPQNIKKRHFVVKPQDPTRDGYKFLGWYVGENPYNFMTEVTDDIVITAKWEALKTDVPKTDVPKTDVPKTDVPKTDVPKTDVPKTDVPKDDATYKVGVKFTKGNFIYKITKSTSKTVEVQVVGPKKKTYKSITIPATVKYKDKQCKVTSIGKEAFKSNKKLTKVIINKNVQTIGKKAFYNCNKLSNVTFKKNKLKSVGSSAFLKTSNKLKIKTGSKSNIKAYKKVLKKKIPSKAKIVKK